MLAPAISTYTYKRMYVHMYIRAHNALGFRWYFYDPRSVWRCGRLLLPIHNFYGMLCLEHLLLLSRTLTHPLTTRNHRTFGESVNAMTAGAAFCCTSNDFHMRNATQTDRQTCRHTDIQIFMHVIYSWKADCLYDSLDSLVGFVASFAG